ncbi:hypothetical protein LOC71_08070 [Rhodopirellula sp. JC740]|uniref:Uncharacterized protein n=1 Tax=Rhodopirellula halodulae TaxID=2894198 RepID=A0ABS8NF92_9BACT|nr:hypothetical protein [Rhodopirellula sp. JC740]MCC9642227.1 hypothetical protein [Rhodopirellula sp. JC740]
MCVRFPFNSGLLSKSMLLSAAFVGMHALGQSGSAVAEEWSAVVLPTGAYRDQIQATPIEQRPGRLFHVYGNTVRMLDRSSEVPVTYRPFRRVVIGTDSLAGTRGSGFSRGNR